MQEGGLIRKPRLISKFINWEPNNYNNILPNVSGSKNFQAIKFGQLIEYITPETFFLKNSAQTVVETLVIDPFLKNQN